MLIYNRGLYAKPGTMWACLAAIGRSGLSISHVCVELICYPSGRLVLMGVVVGRRFFTGVPVNIKCPVAHSFATSISVGMLIPTAWNTVSVPTWSSNLLLVTVVSSLSSLHASAAKKLVFAGLGFIFLVYVFTLEVTYLLSICAAPDHQEYP